MKTLSLLVQRTNVSVYTTWDKMKKRTVVVKKYLNKTEAIKERDVMRAYRRHPRLVRYYRYFEKDSRGYIVMERVRGSTLNDLIKRSGAMKAKEAVKIAVAILHGLVALHKVGFIHGDLHGGNVIVSRKSTGRLKIIDFQHAVKMGPSGKARSRRQLPHPVITLPPETRNRTITKTYDIYGVGFMMACMLKGKILTHRPIAGQPSPTRTALWHVIGKATHADPQERFSSAMEMIRALRATSKSVRKARSQTR